MKDTIKYKEFIGSVHYISENEVLFGKIEGINDLVTFEGTNISDLKNAFIEAVEDYLALCEQNNKTPFKSYKGSFNIRINPELHKKAVKLATLEGITLNQLVKIAIEDEIKKKAVLLQSA